MYFLYYFHIVQVNEVSIVKNYSVEWILFDKYFKFCPHMQ